MTQTKKAPTSAATLTGAVENGTASQTPHASTKNHTISAAGRQPVKISDFLFPGQENARPLRYLKELIGLPGREVRLMIQRERLDGIPILSNCIGGYYLPGNHAELERCVRSLRRRAKEIEATANAIETAEV